MVIKALTIDLLLIGAMVILGAFQTRVILHSKSYLEILSLSFPIGLGTLTWSLFILSWLGLQISVITIVTLYMVLLVSLIVIRRFLGRPQPWYDNLTKLRSALRDLPSTLSSIPWFLLILLFMSAIFISIGRAYSTWDAIAVWSIKGYGIAFEGTIFAGRTWGSLSFNNPLNLPIAISTFKLFSDDALPGSKLIFPLLYISLITNIYSFLTRRIIYQTHAKFGLLFLASVPLLFKHATIGYANLALTVYIVLGALYAMEGIYENRRGALLMSGFLLGFATWTRPEGLLLSLLVVMTLSLTWLISHKGTPNYVPWLIPLGIIGITWVIFFRLYVPEGLITRAIRWALTGISQGQFHLDSIYQILRYAARQMLDPNIWGLLLPVSFLAFILAGPRRFVSRENIYLFGSGAITLTIGMATLFYYYAVSFSQKPLEWWLDTSFNRMILPVGVLMGILAVLTIGSFNYPSSQQ